MTCTHGGVPTADYPPGSLAKRRKNTMTEFNKLDKMTDSLGRPLGDRIPPAVSTARNAPRTASGAATSDEPTLRQRANAEALQAKKDAEARAAASVARRTGAPQVQSSPEKPGSLPSQGKVKGWPGDMALLSNDEVARRVEAGQAPLLRISGHRRRRFSLIVDGISA
jgi:hypothetical protein